MSKQHLSYCTFYSILLNRCVAVVTERASLVRDESAAAGAGETLWSKAPNNDHFSITLARTLIKLNLTGDSKNPSERERSGKAVTSVWKSVDRTSESDSLFKDLWWPKAHFQLAQRVPNTGVHVQTLGTEMQNEREREEKGGFCRTVSLLYTGWTDVSFTSMNEFFCERCRGALP